MKKEIKKTIITGWIGKDEFEEGVKIEPHELYDDTIDVYIALNIEKYRRNEIHWCYQWPPRKIKITIEIEDEAKTINEIKEVCDV